MSPITHRPRLSRARRRALLRRRLIYAAAALAVIALLVVIITHVTGKRGDEAVPASANTGATASAVGTAVPEPDGDQASAAEDEADGQDAALPAPTEPPAAPEATPSPDSDQSALAAQRAATRPTPTAEGFMPVFEKANTDEKIIAITVDDCFQADNLKRIVDCAIENGGKLTIFPIGQNVIKPEQAEILKSAWESGFELENHTYTHSGLYKCSDEELAAQIFTQEMTLCHILNQEYHCHFLRPRGGDARRDQRLQKYAEQMGYYGIAHWSCTGSTSTDKELARALKPGAIYLFHTTNKDTATLESFIPWAVQKGYRLVTMNEMFGYPENEVGELVSPPKERPVPPLEPYETAYVPLKKTTYSWMAYQLQQKLIDLGYLDGQPDGVYGGDCANAVTLYQRDHGLKETGVADADLLRTLLAS